VATHDRHWRGQSERTRAGDNQHGDGIDERVRHARRGTGQAPDNKRHNRNPHDCWHKVPGDGVSQLLDRRAAPLRFGDHLHDLGQERIGSNTLRANN
jgi:hypothetical protein